MAKHEHDDFDPYHKWLGIPKKQRPPTYYDLLGISLDEEDAEVIRGAAEQRRKFVESKRGQGQDAAVAGVLYQIDEAEVTLLDPQMRRAYDRRLNLFHKRRRRRQVDPNASRSRIESRPGKVVGEGSGIVGTFIGVMAVLLIGFGLMAWFSFQLPWNAPPKDEAVAATAPAQAENQPAPKQRPVGESAGAAPTNAQRSQASEDPVHPIEGKWIENPQGGRTGRPVREFHPDGTFVLNLTNLDRRVVGTWRHEGDRVYFSHPAAEGVEATTDKWFTVDSIEDGSVIVQMMGTRRYEWQQITEAAEAPEAWRFYDVFDKGITPDQALAVSQDGTLIVPGTVEGFCLASRREFSDFTLRMEYLLSSKELPGGPFVSIAARLPNPTGETWLDKFPFGIEVKLWPETLGQLVMPKPDFQVTLHPGQRRDPKDQRKILPLRDVPIEFGQWNSLEIACNQQRDVIVKVNGEVVNRLSMAESTKGHIVIWPGKTGMRIRNVTIISDGEESLLPFDITTPSSHAEETVFSEKPKASAPSEQQPVEDQPAPAVEEPPVVRLTLHLDESGKGTVSLARTTEPVPTTVEGEAFQIRSMPKAQAIRDGRTIRIAHDFADADDIDQFTIFSGNVKLLPEANGLSFSPAPLKDFYTSGPVAVLDYGLPIRLPITMSCDISKFGGGRLQIRLTDTGQEADEREFRRLSRLMRLEETRRDFGYLQVGVRCDEKDFDGPVQLSASWVTAETSRSKRKITDLVSTKELPLEAVSDASFRLPLPADSIPRQFRLQLNSILTESPTVLRRLVFEGNLQP